MYSSDLKKLITGFLILSALSGSATLILLSSADKPASSSSNQVEALGQNTLAIYGKQGRTIGENAFVEQLPQNSLMSANSQATANRNLITDGQAVDASGSTSLDSARDKPLATSNLTQNFANVFARQMIVHNPDGPQTDSNGKPTAMNLPDENAAAALIQQAITSNTFEVDVKISDSDIKILATYTSNDVENYSMSVKETLSALASAQAIKNIGDTQSENIRAFTEAGLVFDQAIQKLKNVPVPQPLAGIHRELLAALSNQQNILDVTNNYQTDPLKTLFVLQSAKSIIDRDIDRFQNEINKLKTLSLLPQGTNLSFLDKILGIKKAEAQVLGTGLLAVLDAPNLATSFLRLYQLIETNIDKVITWAYTTALRIAVKLLIDTFQNQVVNWIAGNGDPKFITDWKGFLTDIGDKAAGQALFKVAPFLCSGIGPLIKIAVLPVPSIDTSVRCTLTQIVGNVTDFYNSFQNGGWIAYGATLQPQNNFFGGLIITNDIVVREALGAQEAAKNAAIASNGFLSTTKETGKCLKSHIENYDDDGNPIAPQTVCDEKETIITTPGATVGSTLTSALNWPQNQWISAQRFEELVAAIINAGINRMMKEGLSALTEASNPAPAKFDNAIPAGVTNPADISTLKTSLRSLVGAHERQGTFIKFQNVSDADSSWLALKPQVVTALNQVASGCPSLTSDARQKVTQLNSLETSVRAEFLTASANTSDSFRTSIDNATSTTALNAILERLQTLDSVAVDAAVSQARLARLQALSDAANANLPNACDVVLPDP